MSKYGPPKMTEILDQEEKDELAQLSVGSKKMKPKEDPRIRKVKKEEMAIPKKQKSFEKSQKDQAIRIYSFGDQYSMEQGQLSFDSHDAESGDSPVLISG